MDKSENYTSAEIAVALLEAARSQANIVNDTEILFSAMPVSPGLADTLRRMRAKAEMLGKAHEMFKHMAEEEQAASLRQPERRGSWIQQIRGVAAL